MKTNADDCQDVKRLAEIADSNNRSLRRHAWNLIKRMAERRLRQIEREEAGP